MSVQGGCTPAEMCMGMTKILCYWKNDQQMFIWKGTIKFGENWTNEDVQKWKTTIEIQFQGLWRYMLHTLKEAWLEEIIVNLDLPVYIET
jgi:hypothetical protein